MSRELRICPGVGARKCGAFLSTLDRDPHPTCARCRGKICTRDMTCDFCADWSSAQWELFTKKRSYKERKKLPPSGSVPPAPKASPRAETPSGVSQPGTSSSSFSRPSGGQDERGGGLRVHLVLCPVRLLPLPLGLGLARGWGECLWTLVCCARACLRLFCSFGRWGLLVRSGRPLVRSSSLVASPRSSPHVRRRGELREVSEDRSRVVSSHGSQSSDRGARKDRRARSRTDSFPDRGRHSRSRSSSRSRSRGQERRRRSFSRSLSSNERSRSSDRFCSRRGRSRSRGDRSRSLDRYQSHRDRSSRDRSRSSDRYRSRRQRVRSPARRGARGHAISRVVLMTASGHTDDYLPPLFVRHQGRKDGEPDMGCRRVWRQ